MCKSPVPSDAEGKPEDEASVAEKEKSGEIRTQDITECVCCRVGNGVEALTMKPENVTSTTSCAEKPAAACSGIRQDAASKNGGETERVREWLSKDGGKSRADDEVPIVPSIYRAMMKQPQQE